MSGFIFCGLIFTETTFSAQSNAIPYPTTPDWISQDPGQCGTGLVFADINGDGWKDMIVSNGNDIQKQNLVVYYNRQDGTFSTTPDWFSLDAGYNGNISVGDINGDGLLDVAVSIYLGQDHTYFGGGAKVYFNQGPPGFLEGTPSWSVSGFPSFGCALGDADGDGDLDLAVAAGNPIAEDETFAAQPACIPGKGNSQIIPAGQTANPPKTPHLSYQFIYFNEQGKLSSSPGWNSPNDMVCMDVTFGDINKDGRIDLIFANPRTTVFFGNNDGTISQTPDWQSTHTDHFANQIDFCASLDIRATDEKARVPSIISSNNNYMGGGDGRFNLYRFTSPYIYQFDPKTSSPTWSSLKGGWGSGVLLADVNNDGFVDLLAGRWALPGSGVLGAPLEIYLGDGLGFGDVSYTSMTKSVVEIIAVADLRKKSPETVTDEFTGNDDGTWSVLTLSHQTVEDITEVTVNSRPLDKNEYSTVAGKNLVYLGRPLGKADKAVVSYVVSKTLDIGITNWDCTIGNYLFYSTN